jgi:predicted nucleic acid-binding protein
MKVVITDVSVFFDLYKIQALPEFFALDWEIHTTDFVYNEIIQEEQKEVFEVFERSRQLTVLNFSLDEEIEVREFKTNRVMRSIPDKTVLWKSMQLGALLLTCDEKLRKEAVDQGIEVHGSIWVIEQLVEMKIINKHRGIRLLENLKLTNNRLPMKEISILIKRWT